MSGVRVLRLLEYTYPDQEAADRDMANWGVPPVGAREHGQRKPHSNGMNRMMIRSAIIQQPFEPEPTETGLPDDLDEERRRHIAIANGHMPNDTH